MPDELPEPPLEPLLDEEPPELLALEPPLVEEPPELLALEPPLDDEPPELLALEPPLDDEPPELLALDSPRPFSTSSNVSLVVPPTAPSAPTNESDTNAMRIAYSIFETRVHRAEAG